ncbi:MAG TPA: DNA polymerase Y family protein [Solimonas sp.]|nr:DNA polymerase Y family protein [Solimonas sp.]
MLWLCLYLPALPLEALGSPPEHPLAIFERHGGRRRLVAVNDAARRARLTSGLAVTAAQALVPDCELREHNPRAEKQALQHLAGWAEQFGSELFFEHPRQMLWLEIGSSLGYFGGLDALLQRLSQSLLGLGYSAQLGVAPTPEAAAWTALAEGRPILRIAELQKQLAAHPLSWLPFTEAVAGLAGSGLKTLGEVLRLPPDGLARRFGPELPDYLQRLLGQRADARERWHSPRLYRRRMEFLGAIESTEGLLFPIRRVLTEFQGHLRARDTGVQQFVFEFEHESHPVTRMELRLTAASRDAAHFLVLVRERLERLKLPAPSTALTLRAERFVMPDLHQADLFDQRLQQDGEWLGLLEKLQARLGSNAIQFLGLRAEHLPERSWHAGQRVEKAGEDTDFPPRPFWLLARPQALLQAPRLRGRPERIEGGWWDGVDAQRDYFLAEAESGAQLWVYRDAGNGSWFMHGLWA